MTSRQRILDLLRTGEMIPSWKIVEQCKTADYRRRIFEMRKAGLDIDAITSGGRHYYRLTTPVKFVDFETCSLRPEAQVKAGENLTLF